MKQKVIHWALLIILVAFVWKHPSEAVNLAAFIWDVASDIADGIAGFAGKVGDQ